MYVHCAYACMDGGCVCFVCGVGWGGWMGTVDLPMWAGRPPRGENVAKINFEQTGFYFFLILARPQERSSPKSCHKSNKSNH